MKHSRGVYYVKDADLKEFMKGVDADYQVCVCLYRWAYSKLGTSRGGLVSGWMVERE